MLAIVIPGKCKMAEHDLELRYPVEKCTEQLQPRRKFNQEGTLFTFSAADCFCSIPSLGHESRVGAVFG